MAYTNPSNPNCPNCNRAGLAILPVRYAVVPKNIPSTLPAPLGHKVTTVPLAHHKYALRTLRKGYLYLYYEKHPRGSHYKWEIYSVTEQGTLWKQLASTAIKPADAEPACSRNEGHNLPASVIAIEKPELQKRVWLAFSEHPWSAETFKAMETDSTLRDQRMQTFLPATWIAAQGYKHGLPATPANIEQVIEYQDNFNPDALNGGAHVPPVSKENGQYFPSTLKRQTTRHPAHARRGQSKQVADIMQKAGEMANGKRNPPAMIALWDSVGITQELNGFRNDAAGWVDKYGTERELQISAMNGIEGVKKALEKRTNAYLDESQRIVMGAGAFQDLMRVKPNPRGWPQDVKTAPLTSKEDLLLYGPGKIEVFPPGHGEHVAAAKKRGLAHAWAKYEKKLDPVALSNFKRNHDAFLATADQIIDARTGDLIQWLEAKALVDALTEYHPANIADGLAFEDKVGDMIFGIGSSANGQKKLDEWVAEAKATENNLLWRAIALNQKVGMADLNAALADAEKHKGQQTLAVALITADYFNKSLKAFADTYKKVASVNSANVKAAGAAGSRAFGAPVRPVRTFGADKVAMSAGDRIFRHFRIDGLADHASEKIIQHMFSIRAFVDPQDSLALIVAQAANEAESRGHLLRRLQAAETFLAADTPAIRTSQSEALRTGWAKFKATNSDASNAIKDARLALVVMLIEGMNFSKLLGDCATKNDAKSWWSLAASGITISSALFDVASAPAKGLFGAESWSYQKIKLLGGVLSSAATGIMVGIDLSEAQNNFNKDKIFLTVLYSTKAFLGSLNLGLTVATTFTYSAPLIGRLTGNQVAAGAARAVGARAAAIIGVRILFMSAGAWLTVGSFGIQCFIWIITDDALEDWTERSAFGMKTKNRFGSPLSQKQGLEQALVEVGLPA